jgi:hypothetical protein
MRTLSAEPRAVGSRGRNALRPVACLLALLGCYVPLTPGDVKLSPAALQAIGSETFSGTVGATLHDQPGVIVRDQNGDPLPEQPVSFTSSAPPQPVPATVLTDMEGRATPTMWELPRTSGTTTLTASVAGLSATMTFVVTLLPGPPTQADVAPATASEPSTNNQTAAVGSSIPLPPRVKVSDQYGNGVPNTAVTFAVTSGGGVVVPVTPVQTDASGIARPTSWTMGTSPGANVLRATVQGIATPVTVTATAVAGPPASILAAQSATTAPVNGTITASATVRDAYGNPVGGAAVTFVPTAPTNAAVTSANPATTNTLGVATATWRLDTLARTNTLTATVGSGTAAVAASYSATSTALAASKLAVAAGDGQTAPASSQLPVAPAVRVTDQYNNPVAGQVVTFATATGNGTVSVASPPCNGNSCGVVSDASGMATLGSWTLGTVTPTQTLSATLGSVATATFTATVGASCAPALYTLGTSVTRTLTISDCVSASNGGYHHEYPLTFPTQQYFSLTTTSGSAIGFQGLSFWPDFGAIALDFATPVTTYNIVGAGTHYIRAGHTVPGQLLTYTLSSVVNPSEPAGQCRFQITRGTSITHSLDATQCLYASSTVEPGRQRASRYYIILLGPNASMTIRMSGSVLNHAIEVYDVESGRAYHSGADATGVGGAEVLTVNAAGRKRYFEIRATHFVSSAVAPQGGSYTLTIDP